MKRENKAKSAKEKCSRIRLKSTLNVEVMLVRQKHFPHY